MSGLTVAIDCSDPSSRVARVSFDGKPMEYQTTTVTYSGWAVGMDFGWTQWLVGGQWFALSEPAAHDNFFRWRMAP